MKKFGIITGIMMSIMGGYAFLMKMELFVKLGWILGIVFILNSLVLLLPFFKEKQLAKQKEKLEAEKPAPPVNRKKKRKHEKEPEKKDPTNTILGFISLVVGVLILIAGIAKTLSGTALVYVVGSCVMFYGWIQLAQMTQVLKKEEEPKPTKKKKKPIKKEEKKNDKTLTICSVISLLLGALAICNTFMNLNEGRLVAYSLIMLGIDGVIISLNTYQKKTK